MISHDSANALETHICPNCGVEHTHKFQFDKGKFWVGKASNVFIAWAVYMIIQTFALFTPFIGDEWTGHIIWISAGVTVIFMIPFAVGKAVSNAKIEIGIKNR